MRPSKEELKTETLREEEEVFLSILKGKGQLSYREKGKNIKNRNDRGVAE